MTLDEPVGASAGLIYSTQPRRAFGVDGRDYFVKGPAPEEVFAEVVGCRLAAAVGLPVAEVALAQFEGQRLAASVKAADLGRNIQPWLRPDLAINFDVLFEMIVVDAWLANPDRNMGNVIGRGADKGRVELVMIDYEKSVTLRPYPTVMTPTIEPKKLWPTNELGRLLMPLRPLCPPGRPMQKIASLADTGSEIAEIVQDVTFHVPTVDWGDASIDVLRWRAERIQEIVAEVWAAA